MSDIEIGIDIRLVGESEKTVDALNKLSSNLRQLGRLSTGFTKATERATSGQWKFGDALVNVDKILQETGWALDMSEEKVKDLQKASRNINAVLGFQRAVLAADRHEFNMLGESVKDFAGATQPTLHQLGSISERLDKLQEDGKLSAQVFQQISRGFSQAGIRMSVPFIQAVKGMSASNMEFMRDLRSLADTFRASTPEARHMARIFESQGIPGLRAYAEQQEAVEDGMWQIRQVMRQTATTLGPVNMAWRQLGRTFFWTGLGTMFMYMSLSRVQRLALGVKTSQLSLLRAQLSYNDALERVNRLRQYGIVTGRAYQDAQIQLMESTLGLKLAEDRVRSAVQQRVYGYLQLIYGVVPTIIRTYTEMQVASVQLSIAQSMEASAATMAAAAGLEHAGAQAIEATATGVSTAALMAKAKALAFVTFGVNILVGALASMYAEAAASERIAEMTEEMNKLGIVITKPSSPPLYKSFEIMAENMQQAYTQGKALSALRLGSSLASAGANLATPRAGGPVTITINGPWYLAEPGGERRVADQILRRLRNKGAPI